jgi:hypothetical protein
MRRGTARSGRRCRAGSWSTKSRAAKCSVMNEMTPKDRFLICAIFGRTRQGRSVPRAGRAATTFACCYFAPRSDFVNSSRKPGGLPTCNEFADLCSDHESSQGSGARRLVPRRRCVILGMGPSAGRCRSGNSSPNVCRQGKNRLLSAPKQMALRAFWRWG